MKLHTQSGDFGSPTELKKPVEVEELLEILELILDGTKELRESYYFQAARIKLNQIKKRL